jgi:hypothetical protein
MITRSRYLLTLRLGVLAIGAVFAALAAASCGSDAASEAEVAPAAGVEMPSERTFTFEDFTAADFKSSKSYDVTDLPHALAAHYGFWGPDPYSRNDYEIRFYSGHEDAVKFGQALAAERVGPEAKLTEESATWKVGVKDARECHGVTGQAQHSAMCTAAKYYDYMIVGNMILFCPGDAVDVARKNCESLLAQLK